MGNHGETQKLPRNQRGYSHGIKEERGRIPGDQEERVESQRIMGERGRIPANQGERVSFPGNQGERGRILGNQEGRFPRNQGNQDGEG